MAWRKSINHDVYFVIGTNQVNMSPDMESRGGGPRSGRKLQTENLLFNSLHAALVLDVRKHGTSSR